MRITYVSSMDFPFRFLDLMAAPLLEFIWLVLRFSLLIIFASHTGEYVTITVLEIEASKSPQ